MSSGHFGFLLRNFQQPKHSKIGPQWFRQHVWFLFSSRGTDRFANLVDFMSGDLYFYGRAEMEYGDMILCLFRKVRPLFVSMKGCKHKSWNLVIADSRQKSFFKDVPDETRKRRAAEFLARFSPR